MPDPAPTPAPAPAPAPAYIVDTKIKERPLVFVDLEFTGLEAEHEILQIGAVKVTQPTFTVVGEWQTKVKPEHIKNGNAQTLAMVGYTEELWKDALPLKDALIRFNTFADGAVLVGYNVTGDFYQLKKSYAHVGLEPSYHWQVLDVLSMIFAELYKSNMEGFRMVEVVRYFKLKEQHWHDALVDARATYDIFMKLMSEVDHNHDR